MKEPALIRSVHNQIGKLTPELWAWKINDSYSAGIPDCMYTGKNMLLAEYKMLNCETWPRNIRAKLSEMQKARLRMIHAMRPGKVVVVVGVKASAGTRIYPLWTPDVWENKVSTETTQSVSIQEWAQFVHSFCWN
jgi:hypothetical protein